jgi:folate-binding protein YgfZ
VVRNDGLIAIRVSPDRAELWVSADQAGAIKASCPPCCRRRPEPMAAGPDPRRHRPGHAGTRELFIPQMLNLQAVGGVSFKKGCYTGQEIVARMQYLGKLKRRLYRLQLDASERLSLAPSCFPEPRQFNRRSGDGRP